MTPRKNVECALRGGCGSRVPFTLYEAKIPQCASEREMRNRGLCIVKRDAPVFRVHTPNVKVTEDGYWENGKKFIRSHYETPVGTVTSLREPSGFTTWTHERMFKSPEDYRTLLFMIQDERYEPCYEVFAQAEREFGEDAIFRAGIGSEPLQALITGVYLGMEEFCVQWMDNRDEIMKLYQAIVENRRKIYPLVARSPALHANYGGNVVPDIIGLKNFEELYLPHYQEAAEIFHRHGKLIGCHFDDDCRLLSKAIARSGLDYIEAFTPAPDTDMTLADARAAWPNQVIWLNFPSSIHLRSDEEVEAATVRLLDEAKTPNGLIMGITEDMPPERWQASCLAIMNGLDRHAREKSEFYSVLKK
ncbi:MAG: hypothetical protein PHV34_24175 [Verrucomicrobiae bacterium]|nr:hypothetical protein [Verrucomicrobiae bacterium]